MKLSDVKRWQWVAMAIFIGPLLGYAWLTMQQIRGFPGESIHQQTFEKLLATRDPAGQPTLRRIVVHPHPQKTGSYVITAQQVDWRGTTRMYWVEAVTPYISTSSTSSGATVIEHLEEVRKQIPQLTYRVTWWESAGWLISICTVAA